MADGWIKLHRVLIKKSIWQCSTPEQKVILITALLCASHKEKKWEWKGDIYIIQPGQFITSYEKFCEKCGKKISVQKLRTALEKFDKYDFLTYETTNKNTLVTITNWSEYQSTDEKQHEYQQSNNNQITNKQQSNNNQITTIKNDKNIKKLKNVKKYIPEIFNFVREFQNSVSETKGNIAPEITDSFINNCCDTVDKLIRLDGFTLDQIHDCIKWASNDSFWSNNIYSLSALRNKSKNGLMKFQNIYNGYINKNKGTKQHKNQVAVDSFLERLGEEN